MISRITSPTDESLARAAATLRQGGLVAFPTEAIYGLGADARNPVAVARIFDVKQRPQFDPLIVHVAHRDQLDELAVADSSLLRMLSGLLAGSVDPCAPAEKNCSGYRDRRASHRCRAHA